MRSMEHPFGVRKGTWTEEEDDNLRKCIEKYGEGKWHQVPLRAGLNRCRKSCRLRWVNYLKPNIKRGKFAEDEVDLMIRLHKLLGNRWSLIAGRLPGRTSNDVKNYWYTHRCKFGNNFPNKNAKENAQETKNINIVKPRPRTFSKNSSWLRGTTTISNSLQLVDDSLCKPSTQFDQKQGTENKNETETAWWESALFTNEFDQGTSSFVLQSDAKNIASLNYQENFRPETKVEGSSNDRKGHSCTNGDDLFMDLDPWNLLNTDQYCLI